MVVCHLLAQSQLELRVDVVVRLLEFGLECDQHTVLQEVIVADRIRVEALVLQIVSPV